MKRDGVLLSIWITCACLGTATVWADGQLVPELQEPVVEMVPPNNGAGPLWCYGAPLIVRDGENVYVSFAETGKDVPPLCNTRWQLLARTGGAWQVVAEEREYREREPCPLVRLGPGKLALSANPSLEPPGTRYGRCQPTLHLFERVGNRLVHRRELPRWSNQPTFTDHSYRGIAADATRGELLLLNIDARTGEQYVSFRDAHGRWQPCGRIRFPIRACYPQVALRNRRAAVLAIGDIIEPVAAWRAYKREVLKRNWDYVFRRLFYTWTPDVSSEPFRPPIEIDNVDSTCGHITNLDLHLDETGNGHVLYLRRRFQYRFIQERFFPGQREVKTLEYVVVRNGQVLCRRSLVRFEAGTSGVDVTYARFVVSRPGQLYVLVAAVDRRAGQAIARNYWAAIEASSAPLELHELPWDRPFQTFFTAAPRGGSWPADVIDVFGTVQAGGNRLWYGRARLVR